MNKENIKESLEKWNKYMLEIHAKMDEMNEDFKAIWEEVK